jgi:hypothetical protein
MRWRARRLGQDLEPGLYGGVAAGADHRRHEEGLADMTSISGKGGALDLALAFRWAGLADHGCEADEGCGLFLGPSGRPAALHADAHLLLDGTAGNRDPETARALLKTVYGVRSRVRPRTAFLLGRRLVSDGAAGPLAE